MQYIFFIKNKLFGRLGKASLLLVAVLALGMAVAPTAKESANAVMCAGETFTQPKLNIYPVAFDDNAPLCHDFPALDAALTTGSFSQSQQDHDNGVSAQVGDEISVLAYIHNGAANVGVAESQTRAHNVKISFNVPTSTGSNHTVTTSFGGSNTNTVNASFPIHTPAGSQLEVVPNSGKLFDTNQTILDSGFNPANGSPYLIDKNNNDPAGDLRACFEHSVFVAFKVRVKNIPPPQPVNTVLSINKEVRNYPSGSFAKNITADEGSTVEYRIKIKNVGSTRAINVIATDTFASGLGFVSGSLDVSRGSSGQLTSGGMSLGNLDVNDEITITYRAKVNQTSGTIVNTATADADNAALVQSSASVNIRRIIIIDEDVVCIPTRQTVDINETADFRVTGGNGSYTWSAPGGNPSTGTGRNFATSYRSSGSRTVTVTSGNDSDTCHVTVNEEEVEDEDLVCIPSRQTVDIDEDAEFRATGGTGSFTWSAPGGSPSTGSGRTFETSYDDDGSHTVTVRSGNDSDTCEVRVNEEDEDLRLRIEKTVRNVTSGGSSFQDSVNANGGDRVEFRIRVTNPGDGDVSNVRVEDDLPNGLSMVGNFNGDLGTIRDGDTETITFQANVSSSVANGTCLTNTAEARGTGVSRVSDTARVCVSQVLGETVNLNLSKKAFNDTRGANAETVTANREDFITYTLTVHNSGNARATNFVITDDLSGVLPFADMVDLGGGTLNGQTISYPALDIPAGGTVTKTFRVRVKASLQKNLTFVLRNTYGNTVTINVGAVLGEAIFVAPKTGAAGTSAAVFAGLMTSGFMAFRHRRALIKLIFA